MSLVVRASCDHRPTLSKLDPKALRGVLLDVLQQKRATSYRPPTVIFIVSINVTFQESESYFEHLASSH